MCFVPHSVTTGVYYWYLSWRFLSLKHVNSLHHFSRTLGFPVVPQLCLLARVHDWYHCGILVNVKCAHMVRCWSDMAWDKLESSYSQLTSHSAKKKYSLEEKVICIFMLVGVLRSDMAISEWQGIGFEVSGHLVIQGCHHNNAWFISWLIIYACQMIIMGLNRFLVGLSRRHDVISVVCGWCKPLDACICWFWIYCFVDPAVTLESIWLLFIWDGYLNDWFVGRTAG
jgi:hypothetical protein